MKIQEAHRTPNRLDPPKVPSPHIKQNTNYTELKKNIKSCIRKDQVTYKCRPIRTTFNFSMETLKARSFCLPGMKT